MESQLYRWSFKIVFISNIIFMITFLTPIFSVYESMRKGLVTRCTPLYSLTQRMVLNNV